MTNYELKSIAERLDTAKVPFIILHEGNYSVAGSVENGIEMMLQLAIGVAASARNNGFHDSAASFRSIAKRCLRELHEARPDDYDRPSNAMIDAWIGACIDDQKDDQPPRRRVMDTDNPFSLN